MNALKLCNNCEGCSLCVHICKQNAIELLQDNKGFMSPHIDDTKCVRCKRCVVACEMKSKEYQQTTEIWAAKNKDKNILLSSSSGGIFTELSNYVLERQGLVYGVIFDKEFNVVHMRAESKEERDKMRGSKYVQSQLGNTFVQIKHDLSMGKIVLFTGTPCQIDGLQVFLKMEKVSTEKLISCDVICNGVSSPKLWKRYVNEYLGVRNIKSISFRYKSTKLKGSIFAVKRVNGRMDISGYYSQLYTSNNCLAQSCYDCRYTKEMRVSDISIGDLQGKIDEGVTINLMFGCSVALINTDKGKEIWDEIKSKFYYQRLSLNYEQGRLKKPQKKPCTYEMFWGDEKRLSIRKLLIKYTEKSFCEDLRQIKNSFFIK